MKKIDELEARTKSVPTAAALVCLGHDVQRIIRRETDVVLVFKPEARKALNDFTTAKAFIDALIYEEEHGA
jgi:hypothetical protein